jgi:hypothetical protein
MSSVTLNDRTRPVTLVSITSLSGTQRFQYNPETLSFKNAANWVKHKIAGIHDPRMQYGGGEGTTISFSVDLWADGPHGGVDVDAHIRWLESLVFPAIDTNFLDSRAPSRLVVNFGAGRGVWRCVAEDVSTEHKLFYYDMRTRHATVSLSLFGDYVTARGFQSTLNGNNT